MECVLQIIEVVIDDFWNKFLVFVEDLIVEDFLLYIYFFWVYDLVEQFVVVNILFIFLDEYKEVGLFVIFRIEMWFLISGLNRDYKCVVK